MKHPMQKPDFESGEEKMNEYRLFRVDVCFCSNFVDFSLNVKSFDLSFECLLFQSKHTCQRFPLIFDWFFTIAIQCEFISNDDTHIYTHARARSVDACPSLGPSIYRQTDRHWAMESEQVNYFCCMIALVIADAVDGKYCHRLFHHVCAFFVSIFEGSIRVYVRILLYLFCNCNAVQSTGFNQNEQKSWRNREKSKASDGEIESVTQAIYWLCGKNNIGRIKNTFLGFVTNLSTKISFGHW